MLLRIISGGQTGADQGGLLAARELGIPTGGTAPLGWLTETGSQEQLLRDFGLGECSEPGYDARTKENVVAADGTLLIGSTDGGGSALTARIAGEAKKPLLHLAVPGTTDSEPLENVSALFSDWLSRFQIRILNVAGNRESQNPGIQEFTRRFLIAALRPEKR
jgi:Circularly permutated YpsA SLOG family